MDAAWLTLALLLLLLLLKGFFSGSEIAMVSADRVRLRVAAARGSGGAKLALRLLADPARLLTTSLLGTNLSSVALTTIGTLLALQLFGAQGELVALVALPPIMLIFGEIVPKSIYQQKADVLAPVIAHPLARLQTALAPAIWFFSGIARLAARVLGRGADATSAARSQLVAVVQMSERTGANPAFERGQVARVLRFAQMTAAEVMRPLSDFRAVPRDAGVGAVFQARRAWGERLVPLFEGAPTTVTAVAVVDSWDLLDPDLERRAVETLCAPVRFAPHLQRVDAIIDIFHDEPAAIVVVVDEFGAADGLITLGTLVRHTLGASDQPPTGPSATEPEAAPGSGATRFAARTPLAHVNARLGTSLETLRYSTLGGYALARFGRVPEAGESFDADAWRFTVAEANQRAVIALDARRLAD